MNSRTTAEPSMALALLDGLRADIAPVLAENGQSFDRLKTVFMTAVQQSPDILKCSEMSIVREIRKCAADGLVPDNKEAAMIPYNGELQYQPMVHGVIKRLRELGGVFSIVCNLVHQNDEFVVNEADPDSLLHKTDRFSARGPVVGGYAIFRDPHKRVMHLEIMSLEDFEKVRKASKAPDSPAWKNWRDEMYRKAVLRRGAKYISTNNDKIRALLERQDEMFDFRQPREAERFDPFTGEVIEATPERAALPAPSDTPINAMPATPDRAEPEAARQRAAGQQKQQAASEQQLAQDDPPVEETRPAPPSVPAVSIEREDRDKILEGITKLLAIGLEPNITPQQRQAMLKDLAPDWKAACPEYAHRLLKACVDMTSWSMRQEADGLPWAGDHAAFTHKVASLFDLKKLNLPKYP